MGFGELMGYGYGKLWLRKRIEEGIYYNYSIVVCRSYSFAVQPDHLASHFRGPAHSLVKGERARVEQYARDILPKDAIVYFPADTSPAIKALGAPKAGGFRCIYPIARLQDRTTCRNNNNDKNKDDEDEDLDAARGSPAG